MIVMLTVSNIREYFKDALKNEIFTIDKTGVKTIELIGASFIADEPAIFGKPNTEYIEKEIHWYLSQSLNINDIYGVEREPPQAWRYASDNYGNINSNYGYLIFSRRYRSQYQKAVAEISRNKDTRRATMIYTRPSIWDEYDEGGKSDFICTNAVTYYMRDNKMHAVVQMRSNDVVFGYKNDFAWQSYILHKMVDDLNYIAIQEDAIGEATFAPLLTVGDIHWQVQNLHVYSRHFHLVDPSWES
jgi:thymidylate synthase